MDKAEIDEQGRPVLFWGKADVRVCEPVKNQKNVYLLEVLVLLESYQKLARPGQYYRIRSENSSVQFGRPISVYSTSEGVEVNGKRPVKIQFMILEKGTGTKELCHLKPNDKIYLEGPLGNTFELLDGIEKDKLSPQRFTLDNNGFRIALVPDNQK